MLLPNGSARRASLLRLLAQPTAAERRPCRGCVMACGCARRSSSCTCACGPSCPHAPVALSRSPERAPVHAAYVPLLYELAALRLFQPFWATVSHYCHFPSRERGESVQLRPVCMEYADLLAHHLAYLSALDVLGRRWTVALAPHLAGADGTTLALEPDGGRGTDAELRADLGVLARDLAEQVRRLARGRLAALPAPHGDRPDLSGREREVLDHFLAGLGVERISERLFISAHTVRNHLRSLYAKLGVSSQRELRELFCATPQG